MKTLKRFTMVMTIVSIIACLSSFTIVVGSTVTVTSPNGGEIWNTGTTQAVTWTSDIVGNVRIVLLKNGVQYSLIASAVPNNGSLNWLIPAGITSGANYAIKISECANPLVSDVSDANFTLNGGGGSIVTVTAPNGGEIWTAGSTNTITWTSDVVGNVRIVLLKNGIQYALIASVVPNAGTYSWLIPAGISAGTDYTVKISSCTNVLISDVSDANFTINGGGGSIITVTSPNGGEIWTAGTTNAVTWTSDVIGNVRIVLLKNGIQYSLIASAVPNVGTFSWVIPAGMASGTDFTVKISSCINPLITDVSNANFTIGGGGGSILTVTSPNGGETWAAGTMNVVTWTSDVVGNVRIVLLKNGVQYTLIASAVPNTGTFNWLIPAGLASGADYTVRISSCINPLINDVSNANFTINGGGGSTMVLTSPNGGETWVAGTSNTITWTSDIIGNLRIVLLRGGVQYALITSGTPNDGSHIWMIPPGLASGTDYTVKISSCINPLISDVSNANFTINGGGGSTIAVTSPNGGETWTTGTTKTITWTSDIIGNVRIVLLKNSIQCSLIASGTPNDGSHIWLIPVGIVPGTDYTVKISSCFNPLVSDVSDATFSIVLTDNSTPGTTQNAILKTNTGTNDLTTPDVNFFPNPTSDILNVVADRDMQKVWLLNSLGQTVLENVVNARQLQLNVHQFKQGIYFVKVETEGNITTRKVIIN